VFFVVDWYRYVYLLCALFLLGLFGDRGFGCLLSLRIRLPVGRTRLDLEVLFGFFLRWCFGIFQEAG